MKKKIKVIYIEPGRDPEFRTINNTLEALQILVKGYIEAVTVASDMVIICNEEGRLRNMPFNRTLCGISFFGPVVLVGTKGEDFTDVPFEDLFEVEWLGGEI